MDDQPYRLSMRESEQGPCVTNSPAFGNGNSRSNSRSNSNINGDDDSTGIINSSNKAAVSRDGDVTILNEAGTLAGAELGRGGRGEGEGEGEESPATSTSSPLATATL